MSKRLLAVCLLIILVFTLGGCRNNNQSSLDETETQASISSSESKEESIDGTLADGVNETSQSQATVTPTQEETTHTNNTAATQNESNRQPQQQNEEITTPTNSQPTETTSVPVQEKPVESQPQPTSEPTSQPTLEPAFDIDYWTGFAMEYAQSIGLTLDSTATDCWDNPISANAQRTGLQDDIIGRLNRYKSVEGFTSVWIRAEKVSDTGYVIYIGYA